MTATTRKRNPEARARTYVEDTLGVDAVYGEATEALTRHEAEQENMVRCAKAKRDLHEKIDTREQELVAEHAATWDGSQAAFDRHIKAVFQNDGDLVSLRASVRTASTEYERAEAAARHLEFTIRVATARMEELAGRLHFYGAVKMSVAAANDTDKTPGADA